MVETFDCTKINLKKGSKGAQVKLLQSHLKTLGYYTTYRGSYLKVDGDFGTHTRNAVIAFQRATGHSQDGVFGPKTCPDLNKKILAYYGITVNTTSSTGDNSKKSSTNTASTPAVKKDPYQVDTSRNVWTMSEANVIIQGLNFIVSKLKRNVELETPDWKTLDLMDGGDYDYLSYPNARQYNLEVYMKNEEYKQLRSELIKLAYQVCNVSTSLFPAGKYKVKVTPDTESTEEMKLTIDLTQYRGK